MMRICTFFAQHAIFNDLVHMVSFTEAVYFVKSQHEQVSMFARDIDFASVFLFFIFYCILEFF
jgi:hypothetical protein